MKIKLQKSLKLFKKIVQEVLQKKTKVKIMKYLLIIFPKNAMN